MRAIAMTTTAGSLGLMGAGVVDLVTAFCTGCLGRFNLGLGLVELAGGLLLLWWLLAWWLPRCRFGLAEHQAQVAAQQQRVEARYAAMNAGMAKPQPPETENRGGTPQEP
jgi:hypothetical protein